VVTVYPGALHPMPNPGATTYCDDPGFELDSLVAQLGDIAEALQVKLGLGVSVPAAGQVLRGTGAGSSAFGAIQTGDVAANAITQVGLSGNFTGTTTSGSPVAIAGSDVALTTVAGSTVLVWASMAASHSAAANSVFLQVNVDGGAAPVETMTTLPTANQQLNILTIWRFTGLSAAAHTFRALWRTTAATATAQGGFMLALEVRR